MKANTFRLICGLSIASVLVLTAGSLAQTTSNVSDPPEKVKSLLKNYLANVEKSNSFQTSSELASYVFVGNSQGRSGALRIVVIAGGKNPHVIWDSFQLKGKYFDMVGENSIQVEEEGSNRNFFIKVRGCAPHECDDGNFGFALFSSKSRRVYQAHVLTREDGSYIVTFYPKSGIPKNYRDLLSEMICSDNGISEPSRLPIPCKSDEASATQGH